AGRGVTKTILGYAVFSRVVGDHYTSTSRNQRVQSGIQGARQDLQFLVDGDADRLEHPPSRMSPGPAGGRRDGIAYEVGQLTRTVDGPGSHDRPGDAPGEAGLSIGAEQVSERAFRPLVDDLLR